MATGDRVIRAMTRDGSFRIVAARTTATVGAVVRAQEASDENAAILGDLVTLSILYRETMAPDTRVQVLLRGAGDSGQVVADSHPEGWARGLLRAGGVLDLKGEDAILQLQRPMRNGTMHVGTVAIPEDGRVASAAMAYFAQSEQTTTMVSLGTVFADDDGSRVIAAGGFLVQVLAEAREIEGPLSVMTLRLEDFVDLAARLRDTDADPDALIDEVLYGFDVERLLTSEVRFGCACSEERLVASLSTLDAASLAELVESDEAIESRCDYCGTVYRIDPERLRGLVRRS